MIFYIIRHVANAQLKMKIKIRGCMSSDSEEFLKDLNLENDVPLTARICNNNRYCKYSDAFIWPN